MSATNLRDRFVNCALCTAMFTLMLAGIVATNAQAQTPAELFNQGLRLERTSGDYMSAIEAYQAVYQHPAADRALEAKALLQIGLAYENLGRTEAQDAFRTLLSDYADIEEVVAAARDGMGRTQSLGTAKSGVTFVNNKAEIDVRGKFNVWGASLSPNGDSVVGIAELSGRPVVYELETGELTELGPTDEVGAYGAFARMSTDGSKVAYSYWIEDDEFARIRVLDSRTGETLMQMDPTPFMEQQLGAEIGRSQVEIHDWSDDGDFLLVVLWWKPETEMPDSRNQMMVALPLDGSEPVIIGDRETMWYYSWGKACFSGDGRYVMADFSASSKNMLQEIRKVDIASGRVDPWRFSDGQSYSLLSCANSAGKIIYTAKMLSANHARVGDPDVPGAGSSDPILTRITNEQYGILGSRNGDIALVQTGYQNNIDFIQVDPIDHSAGENVRETVAGWIFGWDWNTDSSRIIYSRAGRKLGIADHANWSLRDLDIAEEMMYPRWLGDQRHIYALSQPNEAGERLTFIVDTESEQVVERWADDQTAGLMSAYHYPRSVLTNDLERGCALEGPMGSTTVSEVVCVGRTSLAWMGARYSPDGERIRLTYMTADSTRYVAVVDSDGSNFRELMTETATPDGFTLGEINWGTPDQLLISRYDPTDRNAGIIAIESVDVTTGEISPIFESVQSFVRVRSFELSPDGKILALASSTRRDQEAATLTIIRNALTATE